jgi:hypothetical protein
MLRELGLIEFVQRRRYKGRFSSYLYRILFHATTGHEKRMAGKRLYKRRTKPFRTTPQSPINSVKDGYHWLFGEDPPLGQQQKHDRTVQKQREEEANRRIEGYEWFFERSNS